MTTATWDSVLADAERDGKPFLSRVWITIRRYLTRNRYRWVWFDAYGPWSEVRDADGKCSWTGTLLAIRSDGKTFTRPLRTQPHATAYHWFKEWEVDKAKKSMAPLLK